MFDVSINIEYPGMNSDHIKKIYIKLKHSVFTLPCFMSRLFCNNPKSIKSLFPWLWCQFMNGLHNLLSKIVYGGQRKTME